MGSIHKLENIQEPLLGRREVLGHSERNRRQELAGGRAKNPRDGSIVVADIQSSLVEFNLLKGDGTRERLSLPLSLSGKDVSLRQAIQRCGDVPSDLKLSSLTTPVGVVMRDRFPRSSTLHRSPLAAPRTLFESKFQTQSLVEDQLPKGSAGRVHPSAREGTPRINRRAADLSQQSELLLAPRSTDTKIDCVSDKTIAAALYPPKERERP